MTARKTITALAGATVLLLTVLAVAGCGNSSTASSALPTSKNGRPATVGVRNSDLGTILVNSQGHTLYLFQKDSGTQSACTGACASAWPPLRVNGKPTVGSGADSAKVGTATRSDGKPQVTYNGHRLYLHLNDTNAGDTRGRACDQGGSLVRARGSTATALRGLRLLRRSNLQPPRAGARARRSLTNVRWEQSAGRSPACCSRVRRTEAAGVPWLDGI
jgi:predicted lipoprotein with Yx(FWY)xxD motif